MSEENYDVSIPCTHPELKKYSSTVKKIIQGVPKKEDESITPLFIGRF
jgi:hypothetical protein